MARLSRLPVLACLLLVLLAPQLQAKPTLHAVYTEDDVTLECRSASTGEEIPNALFFNGSADSTGELRENIDITPDTEAALTCRGSPSSSESEALSVFGEWAISHAIAYVLCRHTTCSTNSGASYFYHFTLKFLISSLAIRQDRSTEPPVSLCPERVTKSNGQFLRFPCDYKPGRLRDLYIWLQWTENPSNINIVDNSRPDYEIEDDYSLLVRQNTVSSDDTFYCELTILRCSSTAPNALCSNQMVQSRTLQLRPRFCEVSVITLVLSLICCFSVCLQLQN